MVSSVGSSGSSGFSATSSSSGLGTVLSTPSTALSTGTGLITSQGVGSGLNVSSIISKLMQVEQVPLQQLQSKESGYQSQLSAYGQIKSALSSFQTALSSLSSTSDFKIFSATPSDSTVFTASADSTASAGTYNVTVNNLAQADKWTSAAVTDSTSTAVDANTALGSSGTLNISVGGQSFSVNVASTDTLTNIASNINGSSSNTGVTATVVNDTANSQAYLVLTGNTTGAANTVSVTDGTSGGGTNLSQFLTANMTHQQTAQDASATIDGLSVTSSSNTMSNVITGVTLNLLAASPTNSSGTGQTTQTLTVAQDTSSIEASAQKVVTAYNTLEKTVSSQSSGALSGDYTLVDLMSKLRSVIDTPASGINSQYTYLSEVGITTQSDGTLSLDTSKFDTALSTDFNGVASLFADSSQGVLSRLNTTVTDMLTPSTGLISARTTSINNNISDITNQINQTNARLAIVKQNYETQYNALDTLMAQMNSTSSYLSQQLASLPKA